MNPLKPAWQPQLNIPAPADSQFDEETQKRIQAARAAKVPEAQIQQEASAYQAQKSQSQPQQADKGFELSDLLPAIGGVVGGIGGSFIAPVAGTIAGGAAGSAAGEGLRQFLTGEKANVGKIVTEGALGAIPTGKILGGGAKILGKIATKTVPERIMSSVFKEGVRQTKSGIAKEGESLGSQALARGTRGTTSQIYNTSIKQIDNTENTLQEILTSSDRVVPITDIKKTVQPLIKEYRQAGNINAANALEARIAAIEAESGSMIPAARANQIKRTLYDEAQKAYGTEASAGTEGIKTIARGIKESLDEIPGVKQLNKDLSFYGRQRNSMLDKMTKDERNNVLGLTDSIIGAGGLASGAGIPAVGIIAGRKALGTTIAQTGIAQGLKKVGEIGSTLPPIIGNVAAQSAGQSLNRLPKIFTEAGGDQSGYPTDQEPQNQFSHDANISSDQQSVNPSGNPYPAENYAGDVARDPKNAAKYKAIYDAYQEAYGGGKGKPLTGANAKDLNKAQTATRALDRIDQTLKDNPNIIVQKMNPFNQSGRQIDNDITSAIDLLGYFRTGATITPDQRKDYINLFPKALDSKTTRDKKIRDLRAEFQGYVDGLKNSTGETADYNPNALMPPIQ